MIGIIFNPMTNKGRSVERMKNIRRILDDRGIGYIFRESEFAGHSVELAKELSEECDILIPAGGDGTVYEVVNGALDKDVRFFPLPLGSGNDVCRALNLHGKTDEEIVDALIAGKEYEFNYALLNKERASLILLSFGIVTNITYQFSLKKDAADRGYFSTVLKSVIESRPRSYRITTESGEKEYFADFVSVQNLSHSGGGMVICSDASECDSLLDLVIVEHRNAFRKFLNMLALNSGKLPGQPNVHTEKARFIDIVPLSGPEMYCIDGELDTTDRATIEIGPKNLRFIHNR